MEWKEGRLDADLLGQPCRRSLDQRASGRDRVVACNREARTATTEIVEHDDCDGVRGVEATLREACGPGAAVGACVRRDEHECVLGQGSGPSVLRREPRASSMSVAVPDAFSLYLLRSRVVPVSNENDRLSERPGTTETTLRSSTTVSGQRGLLSRRPPRSGDRGRDGLSVPAGGLLGGSFGAGNTGRVVRRQRLCERRCGLAVEQDQVGTSEALLLSKSRTEREESRNDDEESDPYEPRVKGRSTVP